MNSVTPRLGTGRPNSQRARAKAGFIFHAGRTMQAKGSGFSNKLLKKSMGRSICGTKRSAGSAALNLMNILGPLFYEDQILILFFNLRSPQNTSTANG